MIAELASRWTAMVGHGFSDDSQHGEETAGNGPKVAARVVRFWCNEILAASANASRCNLNTTICTSLKFTRSNTCGSKIYVECPDKTCSTMCRYFVVTTCTMARGRRGEGKSRVSRA